MNTTASGVSAHRRAEVLAALGERHRVDAIEPRSARDASDVCRAAAAGTHDLVVAFGGDGTVSGAAGAVAGTGVPLACIPGGYTNVFARTVGAPRDPVEAAHRIAACAGHASPRELELGSVAGRPYLFAAGAGFSAALMERLAAAGDLKTRLGAAYAGGRALALAARYAVRDAPLLTIDAGGRTVDVVTAIAQNSDPLTFLGPRPIRICPDAGLDAPGISLAGLREARVRDVMALVGHGVAGRVQRVISHPQVEYWPALQEASISSVGDEGVPVEADGDFLGRLRKVDLGVWPHRLLLLA